MSNVDAGGHLRCLQNLVLWIEFLVPYPSEIQCENGYRRQNHVTVCPLVPALDKFTNFKISAKICYKI